MCGCEYPNSLSTNFLNAEPLGSEGNILRRITRSFRFITATQRHAAWQCLTALNKEKRRSANTTAFIWWAPRESNTAPTDYEQRTLFKHPPKFKRLPSVRKSLRKRCAVLLASVKNIDGHFNSVSWHLIEKSQPCVWTLLTILLSLNKPE